MFHTKKRIRKEAEPGQRFNRLVLIEYIGYHGWKHNAWRCKCDCGQETIAQYSRLTGGQVQSCGCLQKEFHKTHGMSGSVEYISFIGAKDRCNNPKNKAYKNYGGRGIKFLFTSFEEFFTELGSRPTPNHSLDREDNNGNYEPGNVRWATKSQQILNQRPRTPKPKKFSLDRQLSILYNISEVSIKNRRKKGWCEMCVLDPRKILRCIHIPPWIY